MTTKKKKPRRKVLDQVTLQRIVFDALRAGLGDRRFARLDDGQVQSLVMASAFFARDAMNIIQGKGQQGSLALGQPASGSVDKRSH